MHWYLDVLKKYAVFDGRARRQEYWMFCLFNILVSIGFMIIDYVAGLTEAAGGQSPLNILYTLATFLPGIGVAIRRLHDTNRSGWWILIAFVPLIGVIMLLIWMVTDSNPGSNKYGSNPKAMTGA